MKIGIFGGSFNPIHNGHMQLCAYAAGVLFLDRVLLIPTGDNPIKASIGASRSQRLEMTRLACEETPAFEVSDIEISRPGVSYTIDTVNELQKQIKGDYYFITGSDILFQLKKWRSMDQLAKKICFVAASRRGVDNSTMLREAEGLNSSFNAGIILLEDYCIQEVSSTLVRKTVSSGEDYSKMVPPKVAEYIKEKGLYR